MLKPQNDISEVPVVGIFPPDTGLILITQERISNSYLNHACQSLTTFMAENISNSTVRQRIIYLTEFGWNGDSFSFETDTFDDCEITKI